LCRFKCARVYIYMNTPSSSLEHKELSELFNNPKLLTDEYKERQKQRENKHYQMRNNTYPVPSQMISIPTSNSEREHPYLPYSRRKAGKKTRNNHTKSRKTRSNKIRGSKRKIKRKIKRKSLKKRK